MQNNFPKIPLLISAIFFLFSLAIFVFLYKITNNNNQQSYLRETEWQNEEYKRNEIKTLDNSVKKIEQERLQLETHFAQGSDIVPFLDTIEGFAPKAGVKAEVSSVDALKDHSGLMVGMKASGTFNNLYKFLTLLENSQYELEVVGMNMNQEPGGDVVDKKVLIPKWGVVFKIKLLSFVE